MGPATAEVPCPVSNDVVSSLRNGKVENHYSLTSTIPKPIAKEFLNLRRRFGMEIANLLLALYNRYGTAVARRFYRRVADKDDLLDVLSVVESYLDRFEPEARRTLANYVLSILYESGVELIHEILREGLRGPRGSYGHRGWLGRPKA